MADADAIVLVRAFMLTIAKSKVSVSTFEKFQDGCLAVIEELKSMDKPMEGAVDYATSED
jgi:hypothetical protein